MISAALGAVAGVGQMIGGIVKNNQANKITIDEVDSQQQSFADEILNRSRSFETGAAFASARDGLKTQTASVAEGIVQASGGSAGSAAANLSRLGESTGRGFNEVLASGLQQQQFYSGLASTLIDQIAQRRLEVRMAEKAQKKAEASQLMQDGMGNISGGLTSILGGATGGGGSMAGKIGNISKNLGPAGDIGDPIPQTIDGVPANFNDIASTITGLFG